MGGDEPAHTLVAAALGAGKPVVTANKHVVAHHGPELEAIARRTGGALRFEAAVGGGIPDPVAAGRRTSPPTTVSRVRGIVNGTTNFILTAMGEQGQPVRRRPRRGAGQRATPRPTRAATSRATTPSTSWSSWRASRSAPGSSPASVLRTPPSVRGWGRPGITGVTARRDGGRRRSWASTSSCWPSREPGPTGARGARSCPTAVPASGALGGTDGVLNRVEVRAEPVGQRRLLRPRRRRRPDEQRRPRRPARDRPPRRQHVGRPRRRRTRRRLRATPGRPVRGRPAVVRLPARASRRDDVALGETAAVEELDGGTVVRDGAAAARSGSEPRSPPHLAGRRRRDALPGHRLMRGPGRRRGLAVGPGARPRRCPGVDATAGGGDPPPAPARAAPARPLRAPSCPLTDATPRLSLGEGATPLVHAERLGAAWGIPDLHLKFEGANPTGSFKDRGMVMAVAKAVEEGATRRSSAPRPATRPPRPRPTARPPGSRSWSSCRPARSPPASSSRRRSPGAKVARRRRQLRRRADASSASWPSRTSTRSRS